MKDATVLVVCDFWIRVEPTSGGDGLASAGDNFDVLVDFEVSTVDVNGESLGSIKSVGVSTFTILELEWKDSHTNQVASVDSLVTLCDDS